MAFRILAEALGRVEHKLDVAIILLKKVLDKTGSLGLDGLLFRIPPVGEFNHTCPVCNQAVSYEIDARDEVLNRKCGCKTGKVAPMKLEPLPPNPPRRGSYGRNDDEGSG